MFTPTMILFDVIALFAVVFAIMFFGLARNAGASPWPWAIGIGLGYLLVSWLAVVVVGAAVGALGWAAYPRIAAQIVTAYVIGVVVCPSIADGLAETRLGRRKM